MELWRCSVPRKCLLSAHQVLACHTQRKSIVTKAGGKQRRHMSSPSKKYRGRALTNELSENNSRGPLEDICDDCPFKNAYEQHFLYKVRTELEKYYYHLITYLLFIAN